MKTLELNGFLNERGILQLDRPLKIVNQRVKVIILVPEVEIDDSAWLQATFSSTAFDFLHDKEEDIYSLSDGKAIH
ncbi:MAG: hypothetical protein AAF738_05790 [Bacteroidota bacterium]